MLTSSKTKVAMSQQEPRGKEAPFALPPFGKLSQSAVVLNAGLLGLLLLTRFWWLALGAAAGALVGFAVFWSLHLISRLVVEHYQEAEAERRLHHRFEEQPAIRRNALWRLAGMLVTKYAVLAVAMFGIYQIAKGHLIAFMLAFIGAFALTQLAIVTSAAKAMRTR